jgi:hypothetical protein
VIYSHGTVAASGGAKTNADQREFLKNIESRMDLIEKTQSFMLRNCKLQTTFLVEHEEKFEEPDFPDPNEYYDVQINNDDSEQRYWDNIDDQYEIEDNSSINVVHQANMHTSRTSDSNKIPVTPSNLSEMIELGKKKRKNNIPINSTNLLEEAMQLSKTSSLKQSSYHVNDKNLSNLNNNKNLQSSNYQYSIEHNHTYYPNKTNYNEEKEHHLSDDERYDNNYFDGGYNTTNLYPNNEEYYEPHKNDLSKNKTTIISKPSSSNNELYYKEKCETLQTEIVSLNKSKTKLRDALTKYGQMYQTESESYKQNIKNNNIKNEIITILFQHHAELVNGEFDI